MGVKKPLFALLLLASVAFAEEKVSPAFFKLLKESQALQRHNAHSKALPKLRTLLEKAETPFEKALARSYLAFSLASLGRHQEAIATARKALQNPLLTSRSLRRELLRLLMVSSLALERFGEALSFGHRFEQAGGALDTEALQWLSYAAYKLKRYREALGLVKRAVGKRQNPPASWFDLLLAIAVEGKLYGEALPILQRRLEENPKGIKLWKQLAALYLEMGREHEALAALVAAYQMGELSREDLLQIVTLYAHLHIPEKAARLVRRWREAGKLDSKTLDLEYRLWLAAREWEEAARTLAKLGGNPLEVAKLYLEAGAWAEARRWAERARPKPERTLLLAIAAYHLGDRSRARELLNRIESPSLKGIQRYWLRCLEVDRPCL